MAGKTTRARPARPVTISALARSFGLARSTLLHYHKIRLLEPTARSAAGYRVYGPQALARLTRIVELRTAGLSLPMIKRVLDARTPLADVLEEQIGILNQQVAQLRARQRVALSLLELSAAQPRRRALSKESWSAMFRAIGLSDEDMRQWHVHFERSMPDAHADFLHSLGLEGDEVKRIRAWAAP